MTTEEIEQEINERVRFKLQAIEDGLKSRLSINRNSSFYLIMHSDHINGVRAQYYAEAYEELLDVFKKEAYMPVPHNRMFENKIQLAKNNLTDEFMEWFDKELRSNSKYHPQFRMRLQRMLANGMEKLLKTKI